MLKYVQSIDEKTGLVKGIGQGNNERFYMSKGMKKVDIKQSDIDGNWYLTDKCPMKSEEEKEKEEREKEEEKKQSEKQRRIDEIKQKLETIDKQSQRSTRAITLIAASVFCQPAATYSLDGNALMADISQADMPVLNPEDLERLKELEKEANELREELQGLMEGDSNND